jgi:hypothetical protein
VRQASRGAWLGVEVATASSGSQNGQLTGAAVASVIPGSPAAAAGILAGDIIFAIEGRLVTTGNDVVTVLAGLSPGSRATIGVLRAGRLVDVVVTLGAAPANLAPNRQGAQPPANVFVPATPVNFRTVMAQDQTFTIQLPSDWQVREATLDNFFAWSPRGESISSGNLPVFTNTATMSQALQTLQSVGVPPQQLALMSRLVSPPLPPVDVIRVFIPHVVGQQMQDVRILGSRDLAGSGAAAGTGATGALVAYQYTLVPAQADPLARSLMPPPLQARGPTVMKGLMTVSVSAPVYGLGFWFLAFQGVEAPQGVFESNVPIYTQISQSVQLNQPAVQQKLNASSGPIGATAPPIDPDRLARLRMGNIDMRDDGLRQSDLARVCALGGNVCHNPPPGNPTTPAGQIPIGVAPGRTSPQRVWYCYSLGGYIVSETPRALDCKEVQ